MTILNFLRLCRNTAYRIRQMIWYPYVDSTAIVRFSVGVDVRKNLVMKANTIISANSIIANTRGKFIMGENSRAAVGLMAFTGCHMSLIGKTFAEVTDEVKDKLDIHRKYDPDMIVEDDVWIGTNVTLLKGTYIGRGAIIGGGSVVRNKIPPYAIVIGNPAKVINFRFNPIQAIEHEKLLYPEDQRLDEELLYSNYQKYFVDRLDEISKFI